MGAETRARSVASRAAVGGLGKVPATWQGLRRGLPPDSGLGLDLLGKTPALFTGQRQQAGSSDRGGGRWLPPLMLTVTFAEGTRETPQDLGQSLNPTAGLCDPKDHPCPGAHVPP